MTYKLLVVCIVVMMVSTFATPDSPLTHNYARSGYDFSYAIKDYSGNDFGHEESRNGYDTLGNYYVQLPDGRLQTVTYTVNGDSGYVAQVQYQGEARYPVYHTPAPPPRRTYVTAPSYGY